MRILAIETSCDETAIALMDAKGGINNPKFRIIKDFVASQIKIHQPFGGVVPNLAKREHLKNLPILMGKVFGKLRLAFEMKKVDLIAVTVGPGLEPALWTGINFAKDLQKSIMKDTGHKIPLAGVSHLDGHLYSLLLQQNSIDMKGLFPAISLIVSGGHTAIILMKDLKNIKKIGETNDDAVGEAFDKVARMLKLSYPGGPEIERLAKEGDADAIKFPRPMLNQKNFDFSYSGLKTAVLYYLRDNENFNVENVAASFQKAAFDVLIKKTLRAAKQYNAKSIMISGGVAANKTLAKEFKKAIKKSLVNNDKALATNCQLLITKYPTDNAAMIGAAAYINHLRKKKYKLSANSNISI